MKVWANIFLAGALLSLDAQATCATCHSGHSESLKDTPHTILQQEGRSAAECVACHGAGREHSVNPVARDVVTFVSESAKEKNAACSTCHGQAHNSSQDGHLRFGVACSDCHTVHPETKLESSASITEKLDFGSAVCVDCHEDVSAKFAFNKRHRLENNSVTCISCHDPHAALLPVTLDTVSQENCTKCHTDKDGPFIFEHAASRVEGCVACHTPHGSANRHLLTHQNVGEQCYSCHAEVAQFHLGFSPVGAPRFGTDTVCTNCHSTIHGSNLDPNFLK